MPREIENAVDLKTNFSDREDAEAVPGESEAAFRVRFRAAEVSHTKQLLIKERLIPGWNGMTSAGTFSCPVKGMKENYKSYLERLYAAIYEHRKDHAYSVKNSPSHTEAIQMVDRGAFGLCKLFSDLSFKDDKLAPWKAAPKQLSLDVVCKEDVAMPLRIRVALDWNNTLTIGDRDSTIGSGSFRATEALYRAGAVPWILSYIGRNGDHSETRRRALYEGRDLLAAHCGVRSGGTWTSQTVLGRIAPHPDELFTAIVDCKTWRTNHAPVSNPFNGKGAMLNIMETRVLFDDNLEVCKEAEKYGVLAYHVYLGHKAKAGPYVCLPCRDAVHEIRVSSSLEAAVDYFIEDCHSGLLPLRLDAVEKKREFWWER